MKYYSEATVKKMLKDTRVEILTRNRYGSLVNDCRIVRPKVEDYPSIEIPEQNGKLVNIREVRDKMIKYGFTAPDMTVTEFVEDELTAVLEASKVEMRERMKAILTGHKPRQLANNPIPPNVAPAYMPNSEVKE